MKIYMSMILLMEGSRSQQCICPQKHHSSKNTRIQRELLRICVVIVLKQRSYFVIRINQCLYQLNVDNAQNPQQPNHQSIKLELVYGDSILKVIQYKNVERCTAADSIHNRKWKIELSSSHGQPMQHHCAIAFDNIIEVDIIFEIEAHFIIPCNAYIQQHCCCPSHQRCLDGAEFILICVQEADGEEALRQAEQHV